jgi:hypothetical protein
VRNWAERGVAVEEGYSDPCKTMERPAGAVKGVNVRAVKKARNRHTCDSGE